MITELEKKKAETETIIQSVMGVKKIEEGYVERERNGDGETKALGISMAF
jgi:hypothetical protein